MSVIISDFKQLIKKEKGFLIQLILIQAVSLFGVLFVAGVVINNYNVDRETPYGTLAFSLDFGERSVKVSELEETFKSLFSKEKGNIINSISISSYEANEYGGLDSYLTSFRIKDGKYVTASTSGDQEDELISGRFFSDPDYDSEENLAVTLNVDEDIYVKNGVEYKIIGKMDTEMPGWQSLIETNYRNIYLQPKAMENEEISFLTIGIKRILRASEKKEIIKKFEKVVGGKVEMLYQDENTDEKRAIYKSIFISGTMIVFALLGTLIIMYIYLLSKRRNRLAVWRLVGCDKNKTVLIFLLELFIVAEFALLLGVVSFRLCRFFFLDNAYKYMEVTLTPINVLAVFIIISCFILIVSAVLAFATRRITVKELLRGGSVN